MSSKSKANPAPPPFWQRDWVLLLLVTTVFLAGLGGVWAWRRPSETPENPGAALVASAGPSSGMERLKVQVVSTRPHDPGSFTQGLVLHEGSLYESAGQYGGSSLREVDPQTGAVKRRVEMPQQYFAEGLALVGDRLIQLTWQEKVAFVYDRATFEKKGEFLYDGEGWGLCHDGKRLVMSDGSDRLTFRDPATFAPAGSVNVTFSGRPAYKLNELECVDGAVYANVWGADAILRIDPETGRTTAVIEASGLLTPEEQGRADVLNGIAYDPVKKTFLLTGKYWPKMFEVKFVK
jgi:glutaminyl-peptide cyclotransferase